MATHGLNALGLELGPPPKALITGLEVALAVPGVRDDLGRLGAMAADRVYDEVVARVMRYVAPIAPAPPGPPAPPQRAWVASVAKPVVEPFIAGFKERMKLRLRPVALAGIAAMATTHTLAFLLGRRTKRAS